MFEGFELQTIDTGETTIRVRRGGSGPPLLLLHGNPQTHVMWHLVAPRLAEAKMTANQMPKTSMAACDNVKRRADGTDSNRTTDECERIIVVSTVATIVPMAT